MSNILDAARNARFGDILTKLLTRGIRKQKEEVLSGILGDSVNSVNSPCPQLPGTILRFNIPAGAAINLLNLIELVSPNGICLVIRLPFLGDSALRMVESIIQAVQQGGGNVEVTNQ